MSVRQLTNKKKNFFSQVLLTVLFFLHEKNFINFIYELKMKFNFVKKIKTEKKSQNDT